VFAAVGVHLVWGSWTAVPSPALAE
jgi:hypothetical protein